MAVVGVLQLWRFPSSLTTFQYLLPGLAHRLFDIMHTSADEGHFHMIFVTSWIVAHAPLPCCMGCTRFRQPHILIIIDEPNGVDILLFPSSNWPLSRKGDHHHAELQSPPRRLLPETRVRPRHGEPLTRRKLLENGVGAALTALGATAAVAGGWRRGFGEGVHAAVAFGGPGRPLLRWVFLYDAAFGLDVP